MHPDPDEGHQDNENQHESRAELHGVDKSEVATPQTTTANTKPTSPIGKIYENECGNCCNHNGRKNNSKKK